MKPPLFNLTHGRRLLCQFWLLVVSGTALPALALEKPALPGSGGDGHYTFTLPETGEGRGNLMTNRPTYLEGAVINQMLGADRFYDAGFTGQGTITANIEPGHIWKDHETLGHVSHFSHHPAAWGNSTSDLYDRHATWVGMILGGRNGGTLQGDHQTGIAPGTDLQSGAIATKWSGQAYTQAFNFSKSTFNTPFAHYFGKADVINCSWSGSDPAGTSSWTKSLDGFANAYPHTMLVNAAGNSGPTANSVGWPASGYNTITVGALANSANTYEHVAITSSRGPQSYSDPVNGLIGGVRAVVDLVAPGNNLTAAFYQGQTGGNNPTLNPTSAVNGNPSAYTRSKSGTSLASPVTAAGAALLHSASANTPELNANPASRDTRVIKAVLLNSAEKILSWSNGQVPHPNGLGGVQTTQSLDYVRGAGALDLGQAFEQYFPGTNTRDVPGTTSGQQGPVQAVGWDFGSVEQGIDNVYPIDTHLEGGSDLTVTLTWFRDRTYNPATSAGSENAQADLELIVRDMVTNSVISESFSTYNLVEHLHFPVPATSRYQLEVQYANNLFGSISAEEYGLAWRGVPVPEPGALLLAAWGLIAPIGAFHRRAIRRLPAAGNRR